MNLLVITRHEDLVERLRMAFEGAGHQILHATDPLEALARDPWGQAQVLLVDSVGDPMDGYRLCQLLRGEARVLFRNLPIFLILEQAPTGLDIKSLREAEGDGFITAGHSIQQLLNHLGPVVAGNVSREKGQQVPVLAAGLQAGLAQKARDLLQHYGMELHSPPVRNTLEAQRVLKAPVLLLGLSAGGIGGALAMLTQLREQNQLPYTILVGQVKDEAAQRKLLLAGISDWVPLPLSGPRLLHACKRAIEWMHARRIQTEYESALRNEVLTDPLTELLNRRAFDQNLDHAVRQWERHRRAFVLLLGDVDHFKLINDRFGHPIGDEVLRHLAERLRSALRKSDLAFRIGGEEFAILLTETSLKAGSEVADKLRRRIDEDPVVLSSGQTIFPTMSFGVGGPGPSTLSGLMAQVDKALYQAKRLGRNRVVVANGGEYPPRPVSAGS